MVTVSQNENIVITATIGRSTKILILRAVSVASYSVNATLTNMPVTGETDVTNQANWAAAQFRVSGFLYDRYDTPIPGRPGRILETRNQQFEDLNSIYRNGGVVSLQYSLGYWDKVVITGFTMTNNSGSMSSYAFTMNLQEVRLVQPRRVNYNIIIDAEGGITSASPTDGDGSRQIDLTKVSGSSDKWWENAWKGVKKFVDDAGTFLGNIGNNIKFPKLW